MVKKNGKEVKAGDEILERDLGQMPVVCMGQASDFSGAPLGDYLMLDIGGSRIVVRPETVGATLV